MKKIGLLTTIIIGMNAMIGAGIFTAPSLIAIKVGPSGIITFILVGLAIWLMGLSFARLAKLFPEEGAFYTYAKYWSGHLGGLITSGAYLLGMVIGMGLLSKVAGLYLHEALPSYSAYWLGLAGLFTITVITSLGIRTSEIGARILIILTIFPMIATTLLCLFNLHPSYLIPFAPQGIGSIFTASQFVVFNFFGFECASLLFSIVRDPEKNVPRALTYSIACVACIYTLFIGAILLAIPLQHFTSPDLVVSELLKQQFPQFPWLISSINIAIIGSILGTIHATLWASSNLALQFFSNLSIMKKCITNGYLHHRTIIIGIGLGIVCAYATINNIGLFFPFVASFVVFSYIMSLIALLFIKNEWQNKKNIITVIAILTACAILLFSLQGILQGIKSPQ